jgi:hypothetical protein
VAGSGRCPPWGNGSHPLNKLLLGAWPVWEISGSPWASGENPILLILNHGLTLGWSLSLSRLPFPLSKVHQAGAGRPLGSLADFLSYPFLNLADGLGRRGRGGLSKASFR